MQVSDTTTMHNIKLTETSNTKTKLSWEKEFWDKQVMQSIDGQEFKTSEHGSKLPPLEQETSVPQNAIITGTRKNSYQNKELNHKNNIKPVSLEHHPIIRNSQSNHSSSFVSITTKTSDIKVAENGIKANQGITQSINHSTSLKKYLILEKDNKAKVFTSQGEQTLSYRYRLAEAMSFFGLKLQALIVRGKDL